MPVGGRQLVAIDPEKFASEIDTASGDEIAHHGDPFRAIGISRVMFGEVDPGPFQFRLVPGIDEIEREGALRLGPDAESRGGRCHGQV